MNKSNMMLTLSCSLVIGGCSAEPDHDLSKVTVNRASLTGPVSDSDVTQTLTITATANISDADGIPFLEVILPVVSESYFGGARIELGLRGFDKLDPGHYQLSEDGTYSDLPEHIYVSLIAEAGSVDVDADNQSEYVWASIVDHIEIDYQLDGTLQLNLVELLWPSLTDVPTDIHVELRGFPELPASTLEGHVGTK